MDPLASLPPHPGETNAAIDLISNVADDSADPSSTAPAQLFEDSLSPSTDICNSKRHASSRKGMKLPALSLLPPSLTPKYPQRPLP
mmetsp:Transcript_43135/g.73567  ORF Transcript_43135/g.73567 Transcript_43135/m.73567 type:complete len:86 (+) Transcript_43135:174-431(+)